MHHDDVFSIALTELEIGREKHKNNAPAFRERDEGTEAQGKHCDDAVASCDAAIAALTLHDFGWALRQMRSGRKVARAGWNGKGMFLILVPGSQGLVVEEGRPFALAGVPVGTEFNYLPHIDMRTVTGDFVPWLSSQTDSLATDWENVA